MMPMRMIGPMAYDLPQPLQVGSRRASSALLAPLLEYLQSGLAPSHLYICRQSYCGGLNMPQVHVTLHMLVGKYPGLIPRAQTPFRAYRPVDENERQC